MSTTSNQIDVYEGNDILVIVNVTGIISLGGYTATLTVKSSLESATIIFSKEGTVSDLQISFNITEAQNSIDRGIYYFEVTITNGVKEYTLVQDVYNVKESMVYHVTGT